MNQDLKRSLKKIAKKFKLDVFILFGSRATNEYNNKSDWDFAFVKKDLTTNQEYELFNEIIKIIKDQNIDLINIHKNHDTTLRKEIFEKGICIYEKNKSNFKEMQISSFLDYLEFKQMIPNRDFALNKNDILNI